MEVNKQDRENYLYIQPIGKIDTLSAPSFEAALGEYVKKGITCVVDFSDTSYITSAGLRVVMVAAKKSASAQGQFILCGMNTVVQNVFDISGFNKILTIYPDLTTAELAINK
ncbi:MAG TPA: STAS domain-containing protein [Patescibacteria group bacterium]|nr:STAS domain-containing protein [Patescibacteria group bacterium]